VTGISTTLSVTPLLEELLARIAADVPGALGAAVSVHHRGGPLQVAAAHGLADVFVPAQLDGLGGPVATAGDTGLPVVTADVFADERWPSLTLDTLLERHPGPDWSRVRGVAALPAPWDTEGRFVLSVTLDRAPGDETLAVLRRYAKLTEMTLVVAETATAGDPDQMLDLLASRAAIEQAKGAIMAVRRCPPEEAWQTLRRASQEFNVKVRELAVALVEHLGGQVTAPAEGLREIRPGAPAHHAAERLWSAFTSVSP